MKKIVSALLVAGLFAVLLVVGSAHRHTVVHEPSAPEQTAGEQTDNAIDNAKTDSVEEGQADTKKPAGEEEKNQIPADGRLRIGVVLIGDETEGYSKSHIEAIIKAAGAAGIENGDIEWKERINSSDDSYDAVEELLSDGCNLLIANSTLQQDAFMDAAADNPDARFVVIGGDQAAVSGLDNYYNAYTDIYEARYLAGVVAGMKLVQLEKKDKITKHGYDSYGNVRVGYISTFSDAQTISGYSAFYLGMKSVTKKVKLEVYNTGSWLDMDAEATATDKLIRSGCVMIAQQGNSDSVADTIAKAWKRGRRAYYIGCNGVATESTGNAILTNAISDWSVYYTQLFEAAQADKEIPQDWSQGLSEGAVSITAIGTQAAPKTSEKIKKVQKRLESGKLHVFDTSKFTVGGVRIVEDKAMIDLSLTGSETDEDASDEDVVKSALVSSDNGTYFAESVLRSAPYFTLHIDGITEMNVGEE